MSRAETDNDVAAVGDGSGRFDAETLAALDLGLTLQLAVERVLAGKTNPSLIIGMSLRVPHKD